MGKRRAYEVSQTLGLEVRDLIRIGSQAGVEIKNHMQSIDEEEVLVLMEFINQDKQTKVVEKRVAKGIIRRRAVRKPKAKPEEDLPQDELEETDEQFETMDDGEDLDVQDEQPEGAPEFESEPEPEPQAGVAEIVEPVAEDVAQAPEAAAAPGGPEAERVEQAPTAETVETPEPEVTETAEAGEPPVAETEAVVAAAPQVEAPKADQPETAPEAEAKEPIEEDARPKKKIPKPKQISKVVKRIDLDEIQGPPVTRGRQGGGPGGGPGGGRPGGPGRPGGGRRPQQQNGGANEIVQPIIEYHGKRRSKDKPRDYAEADNGNNGKGFRKRQIIDESYLNRRGRGGKRKRDKGGYLKPLSPNITTPKAAKRVIKMASESIVVSELAKRMGIKANEVIKQLMQMGLAVQINQAIDLDTATLLANEFEYEVESVAFEEEKFLDIKDTDKPEDLKPRNPVITVMGHVDHGKTSILDYIRDTHVADGEAGGITQHIGAYIVRKESGDITFLDTPGHEAFTSMRARGAQVTDLVILVVAADDGVMPQTIEAINHAKAGSVPIVVAINKIDKANANPSRVRNELMGQGIISEDLGGDAIMVEVSAKTGEGIDTLLEMVTLQAEVLELKANPTREQAEAIVIEGKLDRGRGPVGTVLVRQGTMRVGDNFVCGAQSSKIKALINDKGERVDEAGPSTPVEILGFNDVPEAGEIFNTLKNEKEAKQIAQYRYQKKREAELAKTSRVSLEELVERVKTGDMKTLSLVVKGDVQGTVEALRDALVKESTEEVKIEIIHSGVGGITESDVLFASASSALIIGFNVRPETKAQTLAENEGIDIKVYNVIYDVIEDVNDAILGLTAPKIREEIMGHVEVREVFNIPKIGAIAGAYVIDGKAVRGARLRVLRANIVIYTGKMSSLRRFKDDVAEVQTGYECGVGIESYNDLKIGDQIEFFRDVEIKPTLNKAKAEA